MVDDGRARHIFWRVAFAFFVLVLLVCLTDLIFGLLSLKGVETGSLESGNAYERIYYRGTWAVILFVCTSLIWFRILPSVVIVLACAICAEVGAFAIHGAITGKRFNPVSPLFSDRFLPHPLLQGIPRPGKFGQYTHTESNLRFTVNDAKAADAAAIFAYGGSTNV